MSDPVRYALRMIVPITLMALLVWALLIPPAGTGFFFWLLSLPLIGMFILSMVAMLAIAYSDWKSRHRQGLPPQGRPR